jgi:septal ring factor EnvC (AmiA/AmiB activator)
MPGARTPVALFLIQMLACTALTAWLLPCCAVLCPQDVVELQLLREVASRSSSFFQAASTLQGLQGQLAEAVGCIRGLRQELAEADSQLYTTAAAVKALQSRREHLQDTLDITKVWLGVC